MSTYLSGLPHQLKNNILSDMLPFQLGQQLKLYAISRPAENLLKKKLLQRAMVVANGPIQAKFANSHYCCGSHIVPQLSAYYMQEAVHVQSNATCCTSDAPGRHLTDYKYKAS